MKPMLDREQKISHIANSLPNHFVLTSNCTEILGSGMLSMRVYMRVCKWAREWVANSLEESQLKRFLIYMATKTS